MRIITRKRLYEFAAKHPEAASALVSHFIFVPHTEQEYEQLVSLLDDLIDLVGEDETHPLASLMEVIGTLIEKYESEKVPELANDSHSC